MSAGFVFFRIVWGMFLALIGTAVVVKFRRGSRAFGRGRGMSTIPDCNGSEMNYTRSDFLLSQSRWSVQLPEQLGRGTCPRELDVRVRRGFTLVELLVVIGIIAVLVAMLIPAVQKVRESATRSMCSSNLKQLMLAMHAYEGDHKSFPMGLDSRLACAFVQIMPYLEQRPIYDSFDFKTGTLWLSSRNVPLFPGQQPPIGTTRFGAEGQIPVFLCPSSPAPATTTFAVAYSLQGISGKHYPPDNDHPVGTLSFDFYDFTTPNYANAVNRVGRSNYLLSAGYLANFDQYTGLFSYNNRVRFRQISDGTSNTIGILESAGGYFDWSPSGLTSGWGSMPWAHAITSTNLGACPDQSNSNCDFSPVGRGLCYAIPGSVHGNRFINVVYADGSVRTIPPDLDLTLYSSLCGYHDGQIVSPE